ncbi:MAG: TetR/AcrR family transcriptional regulator [bacterium]
MALKLKTKDRILQTALSLFNEEGEGQVSTVDIASALGISPGNLYYHFKGKEQIINALFAEFETEITQVLNAPIGKPLAMEDNWIYIYIVFEEIYDFRFFYNNISAILERCPELRAPFARILALKQKTCISILAALEKIEFLQFKSDEKEALSERVTAHLTFWLQYCALRNYSHKQQDLIHYGVYESIVQILPYLAEKDTVVPDLIAEFFTQQMG